MNTKMHASLDGRTPRSRTCCRAHQNRSQGKDKNSVERTFVALSTHILLLYFYKVLRKYSRKASLWAHVLPWVSLSTLPPTDTGNCICIYLVHKSSLQCSIYETALGSRYITSNIFALRKKDCRNWNNLATCVLQFFSK